MKVQDRGTNKWVSLMLPEHVEMLKEVFVEYKEKPTLDEQQMIEIDQTLKYALVEKVDITMTYYKQGNFKKISGKLQRIDQWRGYIVLLNEYGHRISLGDVVQVELL